MQQIGDTLVQSKLKSLIEDNERLMDEIRMKENLIA